MFTITKSAVESDRLELRFEDSSFYKNMNNIMNVGVRKDADGNVLFLSINETMKDRIIAEIDDRLQREIKFRAGAAQREAEQAAMIAQQEAAAREAAAKRQAEESRLDALAAKLNSEIRIFPISAPSMYMSNNTAMTMPYAAGIPSRMKECGASFDDKNKRWIFNNTRRAEIEALIPQFRRLIAKQHEADEKKRNAPPRARRLKAYERAEQNWMSDEQIEDARDSGIDLYAGQSMSDSVSTIRRGMNRQSR